MNLRRARKDTSVAPLPLIALIDVVLFMLMYFIIAGTLAPAEGELPATLSAEKRGAGSGGEFSSQVLRVSARGAGASFTLGSRVVQDQASLTAILRELPKEPGVVVRVDDDVLVQWAAAALQAARDAGFTRVSYVAGK